MGIAYAQPPVIEQMLKLQQYTFVCAPSPLQAGAAACFDADQLVVVLNVTVVEIRVVAKDLDSEGRNPVESGLQLGPRQRLDPHHDTCRIQSARL